MMRRLLPDFGELRLKLMFSRNGHFILSILLGISALLILVGLILQHLKGVPPTSWLVNFGILMQLGGVVILCGIMLIFQPGLMTFELRQGTEKLRQELDSEDAEREMRLRERRLRLPNIKGMTKERHLSFSEMSLKRQIAYIACFVFAVGFGTIAILDALGIIPLAKMKALNGTFLMIPRWLTVSMELLFAVMIVFILPTFLKWVSLNPTDSRWWRK